MKGIITLELLLLYKVHNVTYCYKIVLTYMTALSAIMNQRHLSR